MNSQIVTQKRAEIFPSVRRKKKKKVKGTLNPKKQSEQGKEQ